MLDAAVLAQEDGACCRTVIARASGVDQRLGAPVIALQETGVALAEFDLLQPVRQAALEELPVVRRCLAVKQIAPQALDLGHGQIGQDGVVNGCVFIGIPRC